MGQPFCAQNYALCFIIIYLFIYAARCRNVQGVQQYGTLFNTYAKIFENETQL